MWNPRPWKCVFLSGMIAMLLATAGCGGSASSKDTTPSATQQASGGENDPTADAADAGTLFVPDHATQDATEADVDVPDVEDSVTVPNVDVVDSTDAPPQEDPGTPSEGTTVAGDPNPDDPTLGDHVEDPGWDPTGLEDARPEDTGVLEEPAHDGAQDTGVGAGGTADASFEKPQGIYVLDSQAGEMINGVSLRDANIRDYSFVAGYTWRQTWATFEKAEGEYDFTLIDAIIAKLLPIGKKLTLLIGNAGSEEPAYIAAHAGVATRDVVDLKTGLTVKRAAPWDPYLQTRLVAFAQALADHPVPDASGTRVPLRDHPVLAQVNLGLAGVGRIRNEQGELIAEIPGYTRQNLIDAALFHLHAATDAFPDQFTAIGFWNVTDQTVSPALWEDLRLAILGEFDGVKNPRVGFFQENLAASLDVETDTLTGYPGTEFAAPLYLSQDATFIVFQALEPWGKSEKTANTTPSDGMDYGYETYGGLYYELYVGDLDDPAMASSYQAWHEFLTR